MSIVAEIFFTNKDVVERWADVKESFEADLKKEAQVALKRLLESTMEIQVQDLIGEKWARERVSGAYRNGYRYRSLLSSFGHLADIKVPRIRSGSLSFKCFERYKRRSKDVDNMVLQMFLAGVSTRRVQEVFVPLLGTNSISASSVSSVVKTLNTQVDKYHHRKLSDNFAYLIADGVYFNVKNPVWSKRRCVLVAYGITESGRRELIDFELAPNGESQAAWEKFLFRLYYRGLKGESLRLVVRDGNHGLKNALATIFPCVPQQPCWAHKLRNVANRIPKKLQAACISQARDIYTAKDYPSALRTFKSWAKTWKPIAPKAVECLNDDIFDLLHFFKEPKSLWRKLRTSNIIERSFREVRRRTRPMSCFQNSDSVHRIIFAIFYRQNKIWENKPLKFTHYS